MLGEQKGMVSEVSRVEMKRRGRIKIEGTKTIFLLFDAKTKTKTKLNQFKIFCTGSKNFVLVQKFCTGSEKIVPKAKIELQHIHVYNFFFFQRNQNFLRKSTTLTRITFISQRRTWKS